MALSEEEKAKIIEEEELRKKIREEDDKDADKGIEDFVGGGYVVLFLIGLYMYFK